MKSEHNRLPTESPQLDQRTEYSASTFASLHCLDLGELLPSSEPEVFGRARIEESLGLVHTQERPATSIAQAGVS